MKILTIGNSKGGVGKTTTAGNVGAILAKRWNRKVLLIDLDPQGNLTRGFGLDPFAFEKTIYPVLAGFMPLTQTIVGTHLDNLHLVPANDHLGAAEIELMNKQAMGLLPNHLNVLKERLTEVASYYDTCIIDLRPSLGTLVLNGLYAADMVVIPVECGLYAIEAVNRTREFLTVPFKILRTRYDKRQSIHKRMSDLIQSSFNGGVLETVIRENTSLQNCVADGVDILTFDEHSFGAQDYLMLTKELLVLGVV